MTKLDLEIHDDVISTLNKIKNINDSGVELIIPEGSVLFENILNLKLIEKQLEKKQIAVQFITEDEIGNNLIEMMAEKPTAGFVETTSAEPILVAETITEHTQHHSKISPPKIRLPKFHSGFKIALIPVIIGILLVIYIFMGKTLPHATIKIVINSLPLTRSITVKVLADATTEADKKVVRGTTVSTSVDDSMEIATTGQKDDGVKATGTIVIYNKTDSSITLKKGSIVYVDSDTRYLLDKDTKVSGSTYDDSTTPPTQSYGQDDAAVTAENFGESYNIKKDKTLTVKNYKSSEMVAKAKSDFKGGKTTKVNVVSTDDESNLTSKLSAEITQKATADLQTKIGNSQKLVNGSVVAKVTKSTFSSNIGDVADKLTLTQTATAQGLTYYASDLNGMLDKLVQGLIPQGYVLSQKDREVQVNPLGNTASSVDTATEADLQVTLKTYIVTDLNEDTIKKALSGKNTADAQKYLGSIKEIKTYEFDISPVMPFFNTVPTNVNRITVEIDRQ